MSLLFISPHPDETLSAPKAKVVVVVVVFGVDIVVEMAGGRIYSTAPYICNESLAYLNPTYQPVSVKDLPSPS
jgi:hypothetical protein